MRGTPPVLSLRLTLWTALGGAWGLSAGLLAWLLGAQVDLGPWTVAGALLGAVFGASAGGRLGAWGLLLPGWLALPALAWLAVAGSVAVSSAAPVLILGGLAVAIAFSLRRGHHGLRLRTLLDRLAQGDAAARSELSRVAGASALRFGSGQRDQAAMALGMDALGRADLVGAARWLDLVSTPGLRGWAVAPRALVDVLRGDLDGAERRLRSLTDQEMDGVARALADEVRVLLLLRRDGIDAAMHLAQGLHGPAAGGLLHGLLAWLHLARGDEDQAEALLDPPGRAKIEASGVVLVVSELRDVLDAFEAPAG